MLVLGLDPGTVVSSTVLFDGVRIIAKTIDANEKILSLLQDFGALAPEQRPVLVIEQIASMGMAVGKTTFETCFWSGRFAQAYPGRWERLTRGAVKLHLCGSMRARDGNIRQAIIDKLGPPGKKQSPGGTYGIKSHMWAALSLAVTWLDQSRLTESTQSDTLKASVS